jgi:acyl-CoA thioester hydrolase
MIESRTQITVRYAETDAMGVVYHGNYLPWFEVGRTTLLKEHGIIYRELESQGFQLPVIDLGMKFFRPAVYDDIVTVISRLKERPLLRIRLDYDVMRGSELLVTGFTVHAFINKSGEPVRPPAIFADKMRDLFAATS